MVKGQKERDQYDLKQPFTGSHWLLTAAQSRTPEDEPALLGSESPVAQPDTPILRFTSKEQLRTRPCVELPHSNKFCKCVSRPLNTMTPSSPPISTCPPATVNTGFRVVPGLRMVAFQALWCFLSAGLVFPPPTPTDPSHCRSLTRVTKRNTAELSRPVEVTLLICLALLLWVLLFSSLTWNLMVPMTDLYQPNHMAFSSSCLTRISLKD